MRFTAANTFFFCGAQWSGEHSLDAARVGPKAHSKPSAGQPGRNPSLDLTPRRLLLRVAGRLVGDAGKSHLICAPTCGTKDCIFGGSDRFEFGGLCFRRGMLRSRIEESGTGGTRSRLGVLLEAGKVGMSRFCLVHTLHKLVSRSDPRNIGTPKIPSIKYFFLAGAFVISQILLQFTQ